jgi:thiamine biosynthesis lipoprotein
VDHKMLYDEFRAMNSDIVLAASGKDPAAIHHGFVEARQYINQSETRFTRFTETSELSELNRSAGTIFQASAEMFEVLQLAYYLAVDTGGLFNPAILPALKRAGYDRSMDKIRNHTEGGDFRSEVKQQTGSNQDFRDVQLDPMRRSILLPLGMQVDLGGIAKGWIAEQAARRLERVSAACAVSAGGDMFLINLPDGEPNWEIGLENPLAPEENLAILQVQPGAVATSSIAKRQWKHNGHLQHHLIDARSGEPAQTEWLSITVWAEQAAEAEVLAKVLLIAGPNNADELFKNQTSKAFIAVDKKGWVQGSKNYHEVFHV